MSTPTAPTALPTAPEQIELFNPAELLAPQPQTAAEAFDEPRGLADPDIAAHEAALEELERWGDAEKADALRAVLATGRAGVSLAQQIFVESLADKLDAALLAETPF